MTSNEDIEMHSADPEGSPSKDQAAHEDKNESWAFEQRTPSQNHPSRFKFWLAVTVLCLEVFLVTLDSTILAPDTPKIPDDFHLLKDVGWYCSIYPMAICICLSWSSSCVQHSHAGRAIAGLGSSGLLIGAFFLVPFLAPPARQPISLGLISTSRGVATTFGPLIGDAFTERVSWRWNFYVNLPLSAFTLATLSAYCTCTSTGSWNRDFHVMDRLPAYARSCQSRCLGAISHLSSPGVAVGGVEYSWGNARIVVLLVLFGILGLLLIAGIKAMAMLPARVFT
ncbi:hypothetical protein ETB97_003678 [Aspergillus alliaceus]|uniref:Uncharacterized protein n=1 Tax=Petromyces alliaceus TaxID=209559 RepID=A0A8H6A1D3_PETAA|nr:hypothetical protein ETB97_003678 [Aspergillus burnettii]